MVKKIVLYIFFVWGFLLPIVNKYSKIYKKHSPNSKMMSSINLKEINIILFSAFILSLFYLFSGLDKFFLGFLMFLIIIFVYVLTQKLTAYYHEAVIETKVWDVQRFGFLEKAYVKKPIPLGFILALIFPFLSQGYFKWFALTETEIIARKARVARRHGFFSFPEMTEWHIGVICASGTIALLGLAILAYLFNLTLLAKSSIYFAFFNMLPIGKLDGTKVFFANPFFWAILFFLCLVGLGFALFLP